MTDDEQMDAVRQLLRSRDAAQRQQGVELALSVGPPLLHRLIDTGRFPATVQAHLQLLSDYTGGPVSIHLDAHERPDVVQRLAAHPEVRHISISLGGRRQTASLCLPAVPGLESLSVWSWLFRSRLAVDLGGHPLPALQALRLEQGTLLNPPPLPALTLARLQTGDSELLAYLLETSPLRILYASHTPVEAAALLPYSLTQLSLVGAGLAAVPDRLCDLTGLTLLNLSANMLTGLPERIQTLSALQTLVLSSNRIAQLPDTIGRLSSLMSLRLSANPLTALPASVGMLSALVELRVNRTRLRTLPPQLSALSRLRTLDISYTDISEVVLDGLPDLQTLDIRGAPVTVFPPPGTLPALRQVCVLVRDAGAATAWAGTRSRPVHVRVIGR